VRVLDLATGHSKLFPDIPTSHTPIKAGDKLFVVKGHTGTAVTEIDVLDFDSCSLLHTLQVREAGSCLHAVSPDGCWLLLHCKQTVYLIDVQSHTLKAFAVPFDKIHKQMTLFSPDSKYLVVASFKNNSVYLLSTATMAVDLKVPLNSDILYPDSYQIAGFSKDSKLLLVNQTRDRQVSVYSTANLKLVTRVPIIGDFICTSFWLTDHEQNILMLCDRGNAGLVHKYHYIKMPFKLPTVNNWLLTSLLLEEYYTESNEIDRINTAQSLHTLWNSLMPHVAQPDCSLSRTCCRTTS